MYACRFLEMVDEGFFDDPVVGYRVVKDFLVGFGVPPTPEAVRKWEQKGNIPDDPYVGVQSPLFKRGMIAFAGYAENTRSTEAFIGYQDTPYLGRSAWGQPFGIVSSGMETLDAFYADYGDLEMFGGYAPNPNRIKQEVLY